MLIEFNSRVRGTSLAQLQKETKSCTYELEVRQNGGSPPYSFKIHVTRLSFCCVVLKMCSHGTLLNSQIKISVDSLTEKFSPEFDLKAELEKGLVPSPPGSPTRKKAHR